MVSWKKKESAEYDAKVKSKRYTQRYDRDKTKQDAFFTFRMCVSVAGKITCPRQSRLHLWSATYNPPSHDSSQLSGKLEVNRPST